jgi:hypothetical protein
MAIKSNISKIVSSQIGPLQGKIRSEIQKKVLQILKEFANGCPNQERLQQIITIKNNLLNILNAFEKRVQSVRSISSKITPIVSTAKVALEVIVNIPIPTAIIPPQTGGLGIPISILNTYSRSINTLMETISVLEADVNAVDSIATSAIVPIKTLKDRLNSIDIQIANCGGPALVASVDSANVNANSSTNVEGLTQADYGYKGYTLSIIQDPNSPKIAPRRYAIATDKAGVIRLRGESSFSSSTRVLLDELKFKIDNQFT